MLGKYLIILNLKVFFINILKWLLLIDTNKQVLFYVDKEDISKNICKQ